MTESRYWIEAMRLIDDKTGMQKYESRVPMALHNAKIHRPSVYISAKVNYEKMLEFEELSGRIPRSNLPFVRRNKRDTSYAQTGTSVKTPKANCAPQHEDISGSLNGMTVRSLVCSRCKLSAAQTTAASNKETTKNVTEHTAKDREKRRSDRKETNTSKPGRNSSDVERGQKPVAHFQPEKASSGSSLPSYRKPWRVSEKTSSNVNRLISLLHALDDLPRKKSRSKRQTIGYQQTSGPKRRAKLSKPGRMADAGELFFLQAGELSLRKILTKEDEVLSGLLHVSSKRPTPQHTATGKFTSSAATLIRSTASEEGQRVPGINKNDQCKRSLISKGKDWKQSLGYNSTDIHHQDDVAKERIAQFRTDHKSLQGQMFPALERSFSEGIETPKQSSLPPLYISHHSTTYFSHKQSTTKQAGRAALQNETRKSKDHRQHPSSYPRDPRKRNGESVVTERRCSVSKGGLPPIVIPRVTTPLRGYTPWTDVTPSPCMLNSTTEDCSETE